MRILYIAYPLLKISENAAGGAEQVLITLEREMSRSGHGTTVAAATGSQVAGDLIATGESAAAVDRFEARSLEHHASIMDWLGKHESRIDLIHDMSGHFWPLAAETSLPVLATLHLPHSFYPPSSWTNVPRNVSFNFVSQSQRAAFGWKHFPVIQNGIPLGRFAGFEMKDDFVLWLGRICEEKGPHTACDVALKAGQRLLLAGSVYPFRYHQEFCEREMAPRLAAHPEQLRMVENPWRNEVIRLLAAAQALLVTSTAEETSSLVAMEAIASGTPVVALDRGALREVVDHGKTGFIAHTSEEVSGYLSKVSSISTAECRKTAACRFSSERMAREYQRLYGSLIASPSRALELAA